MSTGKRIMVVEDERLIARDLQLSLEDLGYQVADPVTTSEEAVAQAASTLPDLVLMDIRIRGERDGIATADILRQRFDVPVVFLTAHSDEATLARAMGTSPAGYLVKPLKGTELRTAVEVALHKHEMMKQLRVRERWFSTTLKAIGDAVISTDATGLVSFMNPVAEVLTGWRAEEAKGRPLMEVFRLAEHQDAKTTNPIRRALDKGQIVEVNGLLESRDGPRRSITDSAAPIVDEEGNVLGGVLVFRDVTAQKALQAQLELADRLTSLGTMAAGVAHEINNPLAYLLGNVEMVLEQLEARRDSLGAPGWLDEATAELADAVKGALRIKRIVADLSVFARPPEDGSDAEVRECLRQAVSMTRSQARNRATIEIDAPDVLHATIDPNRLVQVLVNLLLNAVQAIPADATTKLIKLVARAANEQIVIEVADSGVGMSEQVQARIFEPFFTTKPVGAGTGLGLPIVHGIITAVGGRIEVESKVGAGTTFRLHLPSPPATPAVVTPIAVPVAAPRGRILIIDDEPLLLAGMKRMLARDHDLECTGSGMDALDRIRAGHRYDLILCDLMMPDLTGMDVFERLLVLDADLARRMIFVTGGAFSPRAAEFLAATRNPILEKPFEPAVLRALVTTQLIALT